MWFASPLRLSQYCPHVFVSQFCLPWSPIVSSFYPYGPSPRSSFPLLLLFQPPFFLGSLLNSLPIAPLALLVRSEPSDAPEGVSCESASSTSLRVSWRPPPLEGQNGQLAGYELIYQRVSGEGGGGLGEKVKGPPIPDKQNETVLEGLEKWSWYNLTMAAYTAEGTGPSSPSALCRTDEDGENQSQSLEYSLT